MMYVFVLHFMRNKYTNYSRDCNRCNVWTADKDKKMQ